MKKAHWRPSHSETEASLPAICWRQQAGRYASSPNRTIIIGRPTAWTCNMSD